MFHELVANFRMPADQFAAAELLLRIQAGANQWIAVKPGQGPKDFHPYRQAQDCIHTLVAGVPATVRSGLLKYLAQTAADTYSLGRSAITAALNSDTVVGHQKKMLEAIHLLTTAFIAVRLVETRKGPLPAGCTTLIVEEALVCARAGLIAGIAFFSSEPDELAREISEGLFGGSGDKRLLRFHMTSEIWPIFPRRFSRMIVARAKAMATDQVWKEGIAELEAIRSEPASSFDLDTHSLFESDWVDQSLYVSLWEKGDPRAEALAARIAGRLVVSEALRGF